jgi:site-specific recombinase XerD
LKHLQIEQITVLLDATTNDRDRLFLAMTYEHGLRVSEALALTPDRVKSGHLLTKPGKGGNLTVQQLAPDTLKLWSALTLNLAPSTRVFPFTRQRAHAIFHTACEAAGIALAPRQGIHSLRHSIAHHLLDCGYTLPMVQRKLGHKSISSTGCYLLADDSQVDAATAAVVAKRKACGKVA